MNKIKNKVLNFFDGFYKLGGFLWKYFLFVFEIIFWVIVLYFLIPILSSFFVSMFHNEVTLSNSDFILLITAAFILAYTYETKKLREETIFQRKMAAANDIRFRMQSHYRVANPTNALFGNLTTTEATNNVSRFVFLKGMPRTDIGRCGVFEKMLNGSIEARYFIPTNDGREDFLEALQLQDGEIKAWVLITNGTQFLYTFRAIGDGWKKTLEGSPNLADQFILVKKELF